MDERLRLRWAATGLGLAVVLDLMDLDWVFEDFFVTRGSLVTSSSDYIRDEREDERWSIPKQSVLGEHTPVILTVQRWSVARGKG